MTTIRDNVRKIKDRILSACLKAGRNPEEVKLVAVSKNHSVEKIVEAYNCGLRIFGENRVQEAREKFSQIKFGDMEWHLIGHLQTNKIKYAAEIFDFIHSIDRLELAKKLENRLEQAGKNIKAFIQVKLSHEQTKHGIDKSELVSLAEFCTGLKRIEVVGLMTVPPYFENAEKVRPYFAELRILKDMLNEKVFKGKLTELSMGMTHDFHVAIEEGATYVRIGTGIFGERNYGSN